MTTVKASSKMSIDPPKARSGHLTVRIDNLDQNASLREPINVEFHPDEGDNQIHKESCPILDGPRTVIMKIFIAHNAAEKRYKVIVTAPDFRGETYFEVVN
jgi:hypothetical protein